MLSYLIMIKEIIAENNNVILLKIINTDKSLEETKHDVLLIHNKIKEFLS